MAAASSAPMAWRATSPTPELRVEVADDVDALDRRAGRRRVVRAGAREAVGPLGDFFEALLQQRGAVEVGHGLHIRALVEVDAVLMLGQRVGPVRAVAAEVQEAHGLAGDRRVASVTVDLQGACVEVPVGDVVRRIAQQVGLGPDAGHEVDPLLVDEAARRRVDDAVGLQALRPPVEQLVGGPRAAEADEAEVVGARDEDRLLRRVATVAWDRREVVRREDDAVLDRELADLVQRRDDPDVGVEVDGVILLGQQLAQQPGLDRRRQLDDAVGRHHLLERLAVDVLGPQQAVRLLRGVDEAIDAVEHEHGQLGVRVLLAQGQRQDPRVGEVVLGDDRADVHRAIVAIAPRAPTPRAHPDPRIRAWRSPRSRAPVDPPGAARTDRRRSDQWRHRA